MRNIPSPQIIGKRMKCRLVRSDKLHKRVAVNLSQMRFEKQGCNWMRVQTQPPNMNQHTKELRCSYQSAPPAISHKRDLKRTLSTKPWMYRVTNPSFAALIWFPSGEKSISGFIPETVFLLGTAELITTAKGYFWWNIRVTDKFNLRTLVTPSILQSHIGESWWAGNSYGKKNLHVQTAQWSVSRTTFSRCLVNCPYHVARCMSHQKLYMIYYAGYSSKFVHAGRLSQLCVFHVARAASQQSCIQKRNLQSLRAFAVLTYKMIAKNCSFLLRYRRK